MFRSMLGVIVLMSAGPAFAEFQFAPLKVHAVQGEPRKAAVGDVTGDGRDDVVVLSGPGGAANQDVWSIHVFRQWRQNGLRSAAWVRRLPVPGVTKGVRLVDLAQDGRQDIVLGASDGVRVLSVTPSGKFSELFLAGPPADGLELIDVDRDGNVDVMTFSQEGGARILYGNGAGGFEREAAMAVPPLPFEPQTASADLNSDGIADLVINMSGSAHLYFHNGASGFAEPVVLYPAFDGTAIKDLVAADFTGDGKVDLAMSKGSSSALVAVFPQTAEGEFGTQIDTATRPNSSHMLARDVDGDGLDDILVVHSGWSSMGLLLQRNGALAAETNSAIPFIFASEIAAGDVDNDGCQDAVVTRASDFAVFRGIGCMPDADLAIMVSGNTTATAISVKNQGETQSVTEPLLRADLSIRSGTLQVGPLPSDCVLQAETVRSARVECLMATLAPQASHTISLPIVVNGLSDRDAVAVSAQVWTDTIERTLRNNTAVKRLRLTTP